MDSDEWSVGVLWAGEGSGGAGALTVGIDSKDAVDIIRPSNHRSNARNTI